MSTYQLPPLPARPLPSLPEMTVLLSEDRDPVVFSENSITYLRQEAPRDLRARRLLLATDMRVEIEQRFEEVLDVRS